MISVALAGQPNSGKSTIFNLLAGVNQHVANYPGVTVDKKTATVKEEGQLYEFVDLPGTYSFSTYSLEERVAKSYLMDGAPDVIISVVDASCLRRSLYLTFQLLELGKPIVVVLNMMDIALRRDMEIDTDKLAEMLNVEVVTTVGLKRQGRKEIFNALKRASQQTVIRPFSIDYGELEPYISQIEAKTQHESDLSSRWMAIKALEMDDVVLKRIGLSKEDITDFTTLIHNRHDIDVDQAIAQLRYDNADVVYHKTVKEKSDAYDTMTSRVDRFVLNPWCAFPVLLGVIYLIYQLAIVWGYKLTDYTWPLLAAAKNKIIALLPAATSIDVPVITDFGIWMTNSVIALLNYIPIFFILFALIAILEDVGYMPRMAFILDRIFKRYGLHGQSTLPLVLGGAFVGGCAVPGVMATKGIADARARLATILTVPYMNCLAKVPFYTLLLGAFFKTQMATMMFYISTVTLFIALIVARMLTSTVLRSHETAPFVMELPAYHLPTVRGVSLRASSASGSTSKGCHHCRCVAVVLFVLLQYPGVDQDKMAQFHQTADKAASSFISKAAQTDYAEQVDEAAEVFNLINIYDSYKATRMLAKSQKAVASLDADYQRKYPHLFPLIRPQDKPATKLNRELRKLSKTNKKLQIEIKSEKIANSFLGMLGRAMEPLTRYAGFDWRINVAFLSSFAARESAVATLGSIYEKGQSNLTPEQAMAQDGAYTPIHAATMLLFMILTPPCIATMVVVKLQSNSFRWMLFAIFFPIILGIVISTLFFSLAANFGWSGVDMMRNFYICVVALTLFLGLIKTKRSGWRAGEISKG